MTSPARTSADLHARLGRLHPLTVAKHASAFTVTPDAPTHSPAAVMFRGQRCLRCLQLSTPDRLGVCEQCRAAAATDSEFHSDPGTSQPARDAGRWDP